ncbi:heavy metal-binding domain-containing protein [Niabella sp. CC-SYL272]|uniref:YbjQ family protein n=1 Tax=Niabella agricola TaxID=2891571 RepID=UPI001F3A403B|nr:heavy metal-binding domain-containing protein [Niabella agricola]MCF3110914.1 heavy metal-binding domain-containing protein [Niabella agricola]
MRSKRDVLVLTTSSIEGRKIKSYLKPVSAHVVAGTNMFKDLFASFSDIFGGRSQTYQRELSAIYNEAIEAIKAAAFNIGANCILGLKIDIDEISGGGKSMFMITAVGTAAVLEEGTENIPRVTQFEHNPDIVSLDRLTFLNKRKSIIEEANAETLRLTDDIWNLITAHQVTEVAPYLFKKCSSILASTEIATATQTKYQEFLTRYIDALPHETKIDLLYSAIEQHANAEFIKQISNILQQLHLLDFDRCRQLLEHNDFNKQKVGLKIATFDKPHYDKEDLRQFEHIKQIIESVFKERGMRVMKKQLLSSKEREVWNCECKKNNIEMGVVCDNCGKDIYGFTNNETGPAAALDLINNKVGLLVKCLN